MKRQKKTTLVIRVFLFIAFCFFTIGSSVSMAKPIELKVTSFNPPHITPMKMMQEWAKAVEKRTDGKVKFTFYWAGSLAKMEDTFRAIQTGLADIGFWNIGAVAGLTPLNEYVSLPFLGYKDLPTLYKVYKDMQSTTPELQAEFKGLNMIYAYTNPPYQIHTVNKLVRVPGDIRGMKLMSDPKLKEFLSLAGAVTVAKGPPDWYMSLQKGLVEGHITHFSVVKTFKLLELVKYHTRLGEAGIRSSVIGWYMNSNSFNKLPADVQQVIMDLKPEFEQRSFTKNDSDLKIATEAARKTGHPVIDLKPEELKQWIKLGEAVQNKWAEKMEAQGKPGKKILTKAKQMIAEYNKK